LSTYVLNLDTRKTEFKTAHPCHAELVIEVAISSLELDREKARIYAAASIPQYLIVIPAEKKIEIYTDPKDGKYRTIKICRENESVKTNWDSLDLTLLFNSTTTG
jgi:Uma2 family endonuclease